MNAVQDAVVRLETGRPYKSATDDDFGAVGDGVTDDSAAIQALLDSPAVGESNLLVIPAGTYYMGSTTLRVRRQVVVQGAGWNATKLVWDDGTVGVIVDRAVTSEDGGAGDWSVLRDLTLTTDGSTTWELGEVCRVWVAGSGYAIGDAITLALDATVEVTAVDGSGGVADCRIVSRGTPSTSRPSIVPSSTAGGGGAGFRPVLGWRGAVKAVETRPEINDAGSGYRAGETLTLSGGTSTAAATVYVDSVDGSGAITGIRLLSVGKYSATPPNPVGVTGGSGSGAQFDVVWVGAGHGIRAYARFTTDNVVCEQFGGHGVFVGAGSSFKPFTGNGSTNANNFHINGGRCHANGGSGIFLSGSDANQGTLYAVDVSGNSEWGIRDESFLGCQHHGHHASANGKGPFAALSDTGFTTWVGCYSEGGATGASKILSPGVVIGGDHGAGFTDDTNGAVLSSDQTGLRMRNSAYVKNTTHESDVVRVGFGDTSGQRAALWFGIAGRPSPHTLRYEPGRAGWWDLLYRNSTAYSSFRIADDQNADGVPDGAFAFPNGYFMFQTSTGPHLVRVHIGTAAPTTGTWRRGDRVYNRLPSAGGSVGWVCVTAGTPGTWKAFGNIEV